MGVLHAYTGRLVQLGIEDDLCDNAVRLKRHVAGVVGCDQRGAVGRHVGAERTAAHAKVAALARAPSEFDLLFGRLGQVRRAADGDPALRESSFDPGFEILLDNVEIHRRLEDAVRQVGQTLCGAADTHPALDIIVPRRNVGIADRPVSADALLGVGFEIQIAPAIALPAPGDRTTANMIAANPVEAVHFGVGMFVILHEPVVPLIVDRVAGALLLEIVLLHLVERRAAARIAEVPRVFCEGRVILAVFDLAAALEHECLETFFAQVLRSPSAGEAAAHHDRVERTLFARCLV